MELVERARHNLDPAPFGRPLYLETESSTRTGRNERMPLELFGR